MKKRAIIFDIDNTILYQTNRSPFIWDDLSGDKIIPQMAELINLFICAGYEVIFVTGRPEKARHNTTSYLETNLFPLLSPEITIPCLLYMNAGVEFRKGWMSKKENLDLIRAQYDVIMAFDDNEACAQMYIDNNIMTLMPLNYKIK